MRSAGTASASEDCADDGDSGAVNSRAAIAGAKALDVNDMRVLDFPVAAICWNVANAEDVSIDLIPECRVASQLWRRPFDRGWTFGCFWLGRWTWSRRAFVAFAFFREFHCGPVRRSQGIVHFYAGHIVGSCGVADGGDESMGFVLGHIQSEGYSDRKYVAVGCREAGGYFAII